MGAVFSPPVAGFTPYSVTQMLAWLNADRTTNLGDNSICDPCANVAPGAVSQWNGASPGTGPLLLDPSGRRGMRCLSWQNAQCLELIDTAVNALGTGAAKDFELCWVMQPFSTQASYEGGMGNTANFVNYMYLLRDSIQQILYWRNADPSNPDSVTPLSTIPQGLFPGVLRLSHTASTHKLQLTLDHVAMGAPIDFPWSNSRVQNIYTIGSIRTTVNTIQSYARIRHHLIYGKLFSVSEGQNFDDWGLNEWGSSAYSFSNAGPTSVRMNWKGGSSKSASFGRGTGRWKLKIICGDSQGTAFGCTEFYVSKHIGTKKQAYALFPDGNVGPMTGVPLNDPTDKVPMIQDSAPGGTMDAWTRSADYIIDNDPDGDNLLYMNSCLASCLVQGTSGIMLNSGLTAVPPPIDQPYGRIWYFLQEMLKAGVIADVCVYVMNGEPHAANPPFQGATIANLKSGLHAFLDRLNVILAGFWTSPIHFLLNRPPVTPATDYAAFWPQMRTAIQEVVDERTDSAVVNGPDGPRDAQLLHIINGVNTPGAETGKLGIGVEFAKVDLARP